jgi:hypothetical protein
MPLPRKMRAPNKSPTGATFSMSLTPEAIATLSRVSTATITTVLLKKGLRNVWMRGSRPLRPGQPRLVGSAFTLRFVPAREDLATPESWSSPIRPAPRSRPCRRAVSPVDAMGVKDAGIFGDILRARGQTRRGGAGDRRRGARSQRRARDWPAGVRHFCRAALGRRIDFVAGAS